MRRLSNFAYLCHR